MNKVLIFVLLVFLFVNCTKKENKREMENAASISKSTNVDTMLLKRKSFYLQLVCNGKLQAMARSEISFYGQGVVTDIMVSNGMRVKAGQLLAVIDKDDKIRQLKKCETEMVRAEVALIDKLISMGYDGIDDNVPVEVMKRAKITSGFESAQLQLTEAKKSLDNCELRAPFSGRVADMECQPYQMASKFGKLIDDSFFDVEFSVLEAELLNIHNGQSVKVKPFISEQKTFDGKITQINPRVDEKGLVKVKARIRNMDEALMDGMNVKVIVEKVVPDMFVVPKSAVVERDGYNVIFEVEDSQAIWTYVDINYENLTHYAISGCKVKETEINEGEVVIISDNQNLADGTKVTIN